MDKDLREKLEKDQFHGKGGAYVVGEDGVRRRAIDEDGKEIHPTQDHPEGNAPRDKDGNLLENEASRKLDAARAKKAAAQAERTASPAQADRKGGSK
jgi:hypothetical protein